MRYLYFNQPGSPLLVDVNTSLVLGPDGCTSSRCLAEQACSAASATFVSEQLWPMQPHTPWSPSAGAVSAADAAMLERLSSVEEEFFARVKGLLSTDFVEYRDVIPDTYSCADDLGCNFAGLTEDVSAQTSKKDVKRACAGCGRLASRDVKVHRCSVCLSVAYCGRDCQKADWSAHKLVCCKV